MPSDNAAQHMYDGLTSRQIAAFKGLLAFFKEKMPDLDQFELMSAFRESLGTGVKMINDQGQISAQFAKAVQEQYTTANPDTDTSGLPKFPGDKKDAEKKAREKARLKEERRQRRLNNVATWNGLLTSYGLNSTPNIDNLVNQAAKEGWNSARFLNELRDTAEYQNRFVGIFDEDGNLKMSESQYLSQEARYKDIAGTTGLNLGKGKLGALFEGDVSTGEFRQKAAALVRIQNNPEMFRQFGAVLANEGLAKGFTHKDAFAFVMGEAPKEWYNVWNEALSRYTATQAGINIAGPKDRYTHLSAGAVEKIGDKGLSEEALSTGYKELAQQLKTTMPLSKIHKFNLTKQDLIELEFGGSRQASVAQKVQQILKNEENIQSGPKANIGGQAIGSTSAGAQQRRAQSY